MYSMCLGFMAKGHRVTLAAAADFKPVTAEDYDFEVHFFKSVFTRIFLPPIFPLSFEFLKWLRANHKKYDIVLSSETFSFATLFLSMVCPSKTVIWQEIMGHHVRLKKMPSYVWHYMIVPLFIRRVRCVVPRSRRVYMFISKFFKNTSNEVVDHGVNEANFDYSKEKEWQIVISARLVPGKNVESMILVYSKLIRLEGFEDLKLRIVGDGESREGIEKLVDELNLRDSVSFLGFLKHKDLNEVVKKSRIFMVNTLRDLNMVSIPEAIVSGTPVITNRLPASADYIAREKLGVAKDNWDEYDLKEILENNAIYVDNCINYRDKLTNSFCANKIIEIYNSYC